MTVQIVFETHSLTEDNERGVATGWLEGRLSDRGRLLARQLGERRRSDGLAAVFTSDLGRAVETVDIAFGGSGLPILKDWRLRECNYGELNGAPVSQLHVERAMQVGTPFPEGESWQQAVLRHDWFLDDLVRRHDGERVLVIGHMATRYALEHLVVGEALEALVSAPFEWQEGWLYELATRGRPRAARR